MMGSSVYVMPALAPRSSNVAEAVHAVLAVDHALLVFLNRLAGRLGGEEGDRPPGGLQHVGIGLASGFSVRGGARRVGQEATLDAPHQNDLPPLLSHAQLLGLPQDRPGVDRVGTSGPHADAGALNTFEATA